MPGPQRAVKADPNNGETWATLAYTYLLRSAPTPHALPSSELESIAECRGGDSSKSGGLLKQRGNSPPN